MINNNMPFNKRATLILHRKMSLKPQMLIARELGISQSSYSNIENGYADPSPDVEQKLIEMFDLPENYFREDE